MKVRGAILIWTAGTAALVATTINKALGGRK